MRLRLFLILKRNDELQMRVQGIEALSYLMSSTIAKESIVTNSKATGNVLASLVSLAKDDELTNETTTNKDKKTTTNIKKAKENQKKKEKTQTKHSCGYGTSNVESVFFSFEW